MRAGSGSETARRVAAQRLSMRRVPFDGGRPDDDQRLQADVAAGVDVAPDSLMARYLAARTAFVDRVVVAWVSGPGGGRQVGSVGAGYDGRAFRYAVPGVRWFELDHPDTQADKRARLERLGIDASSIGFVAADFAVDDVAAALCAVGHDREVPTLFTCEGVAGYLPIDVLTSLLRALASCAAPGSRLAITLHLEPESAAQRAARTRLTTSVGAVGEPLASSLPRAGLRAFLESAGWTVERAVDPTGAGVDDSDRASAFVVARVRTSGQP